MNARSFVRPPWIESDGRVFTVVVEAYLWCGHPRWGSAINRFEHPTFPAAVAHLERLGFTIATPI